MVLVVKYSTNNAVQQQSSCHSMTTAPASATPSPSPSSNEACIWDVQDILAERTSINGENELLVVWKPSWIPISNMADGPVMQRFKATPQWTYSSAKGQMRLKLPVEVGTDFADDCSAVLAAAAAQHGATDDSDHQSTATTGSGTKHARAAVTNDRQLKRPMTTEQSPSQGPLSLRVDTIQ
jgi:hypothetical protein